MNARSQEILPLLEKMTSPDKDFRFMAASDLIAKLIKERTTFDENLGEKIVKVLMKLVEDTNGEVQNLAVKALGLLIGVISLQQSIAVIETLCTNIESHREQFRDVSSMALKTVVANIPVDSSKKTEACIIMVVPKLIKLLSGSEKIGVSIKIELLEILSSVIQHHGKIVGLSVDEIEQALFLQLGQGKQSLRNRAVSALGVLVSIASETQFDRIVKIIISGCSGNKRVDVHNYTLACASVCRASPARFAQYLPKILPNLIDSANNLEDEELKELSLQALEVFVSNCAKETKSFVKSIGDACVSSLQFDPNYIYDDVSEDGDEPMETGDSAQSESDDDTANESDDDDDVNWKVRRAAVKCMGSLIKCYPPLLPQNLSKFGPVLIGRFKERENTVKYDIFLTYIALLKEAQMILPETMRVGRKGTDRVGVVSPREFQEYICKELKEEDRRVFQEIESQIPVLVRAIQKQMKPKSLKSIQHAFLMVMHLLRAFPGALSSYLNLFSSPIHSTFKSPVADGGMKMSALKTVESIILTHNPEDLCSFISDSVPLVVEAIDDPLYKLSSEGLEIASTLLSVFKSNELDKAIYLEQDIMLISKAVISKLRVQAIDQEVKERAIFAIGKLASLFGKLQSVKVDECVRLLVEQLGNELVRCAALKALNSIVCSDHDKSAPAYDFPVLLPILASFLRKNEKSLQVATLSLLKAVVIKFANGGISNVGMNCVINELPKLLDQQDFSVVHPVLEFLNVLLNSYPNEAASASEEIFGSLVRLTHVPVLQGSTLITALDVFAALVRSNLLKNVSFERMVDKVSSPVYDVSGTALLHRQVYISIAKTIATIALAFNDLKKTQKLISTLRSLLSVKGESDSRMVSGVITLGEIGRIFGSAYESSHEEESPKEFMISLFEHPLEEVKTSASYALGSLAVGNLQNYIPLLLQGISGQDKKHKYLFLQSLKEVINSHENFTEGSKVYFATQIEVVWQALLVQSSVDEEGICSLVAECVGKVCVLRPPDLISSLLLCSTDPSAGKRKCAIVAIRFVIFDHPAPIDELLKPIMVKFLEAVRDPVLSVRRSAIMTMNAVVHNKLELINSCLPSLLSALYSETLVKKELVREVEMGPFKHIVDDGLDLRKAAFECMYTVCERCIDRIDVDEYVSFVENGLKDQHDIQLLTFLILIRLCQKCPLKVSQRIDQLCELIKPILRMQPKPNAVKQENEKQGELKQSAMKVLVALKNVPGQLNSSQLTAIMEFIRDKPELSSMLSAVKPENSSAGGVLH